MAPDLASLADFKMLYLSEFWELCTQISQGNQPRVKVVIFGSFEPTCQFYIYVLPSAPPCSAELALVIGSINNR